MRHLFFALVLVTSGCSSAVPSRHIHPPTPQTSLASQPGTRAKLSSFTRPVPHINLAWNRSHDADGYKLFWNDQSTNLPIMQTNITLYMPKGVYTFALYATNSMLSSDPAILRDIPVPYPWPMWVVVRNGTNEVFRINYPASGPNRWWTNGYTIKVER